MSDDQVPPQVPPPRTYPPPPPPEFFATGQAEPTPEPPGEPPGEPTPEPPPEPPGGPQKRYSVGAVIGWALLTLVALIVVEVVLIWISVNAYFLPDIKVYFLPDIMAGYDNPGDLEYRFLADIASDVVIYASAFVGLVTGILAMVMLRRAITVRPRSRWLGIIIGSAVHLIVFGGLCVALFTMQFG